MAVTRASCMHAAGNATGHVTRIAPIAYLAQWGKRATSSFIVRVGLQLGFKKANTEREKMM